MKKIILPVVAALAILTSCGQSAEEKANREKYMKDSIESSENMQKDAVDERLKMMQDSMRVVEDSMSARMEREKDQIEQSSDANKKEIDRMKKQKKQEKKMDDKEKENAVKPGQGRG